MPLKILLVARSFLRGGSATGARMLVESLRKAGGHVICASGDSGARRLSTARFIERVCEHVSGSSNLHFLKFAPASLELPRLLDQYRPDIVQLCDISGNCISLSALNRTGVPVVHRLSDYWPYAGASHYPAGDQPHQPFDFLHRALVWRGLNRLPTLVAPSAWLAQGVTKRLSGYGDFPRIQVIPNAVNINATLRVRAVSENSFHFGFISTHLCDPRKGLHLVVPFLRNLQNKGHQVVLHCHGHGDIQSIEDMNLINATNHGPFKSQDAELVFGSFDILLCPSLADNSPNVVCEAAIRGIPVIGQNGSGVAPMMALTRSPFPCRELYHRMAGFMSAISDTFIRAKVWKRLRLWHRYARGQHFISSAAIPKILKNGRLKQKICQTLLFMAFSSKRPCRVFWPRLMRCWPLTNVKSMAIKVQAIWQTGCHR